MIDKLLLDILCCPACKGDLKLEAPNIICKKCKKQYPLKGKVPVLLADRAVKRANKEK